VTRAREKGTAAESAVVGYLQQHGFPLAERRALAGAMDRGDVAGIPGVAVEVKAVARPAYQQWLREAAAEAANAGVPLGVVVHKPAGVGLARPGDFIVALRLAGFVSLIREDR
jgi:hypothetical protein